MSEKGERIQAGPLRREDAMEGRLPVQLEGERTRAGAYFATTVGRRARRGPIYVSAKRTHFIFAELSMHHFYL